VCKARCDCQAQVVCEDNPAWWQQQQQLLLRLCWCAGRLGWQLLGTSWLCGWVAALLAAWCVHCMQTGVVTADLAWGGHRARALTAGATGCWQLPPEPKPACLAMCGLVGLCATPSGLRRLGWHLRQRCARSSSRSSRRSSRVSAAVCVSTGMAFHASRSV
jgi:hypothetical protein